MTEVIAKTTKKVGFVAFAIFFFSYIFYAFWNHIAENITINLRQLYLKSLLK